MHRGKGKVIEHNLKSKKKVHFLLNKPKLGILCCPNYPDDMPLYGSVDPKKVTCKHCKDILQNILKIPYKRLAS